MSPECSEDYRTRRPVSRSNTTRELSEKEKARKKRSYELWERDRESERLHEERKKRFIEEYNWKQKMGRHGRTGSQKGDNQRSPDRTENPPTDEEIEHALRIIRNAEPRQLVTQVRTLSGGTDPPPRPDQVPSTSGSRLRPARSPGRYNGDGAPRRSSSPPRRTEGRSTSRNRIRTRSPRRSNSRQRRTECRRTSRHRTRSRSLQRHDSRGDGSRHETSPYRRRSEGPLTSGDRRRSRSPQRQNSRGSRASTSGRREDRLRHRLCNHFGQCTHTTSPTCRIPCPLDPRYCSHPINCVCHRCPECEHVREHAHTCSRRRRSPPRRAPEPRRVTPPVSRPVPPQVLAEPRPLPPQVAPAIRRPPSPVYPLPNYLYPLLPGRIYLYFPMGRLGAHYIATTPGSRLHNWWQRYRNMPFPGHPPIYIPFLQSDFTVQQIPPAPQPLSFGNMWYPPPPPQGPYYRGP